MTMSRKILLFSFLGLLTLILASLAYLITLDSKQINYYLQNFVAEHTHYQLRLDDSTSIRWRGQLAVHANHISLQKQQSERPFFNAERVTFSLNWRQLLAGQIDLDNVMIDSPQIVLYQDKKSKAIKAQKPSNDNAQRNPSKPALSAPQSKTNDQTITTDSASSLSDTEETAKQLIVDHLTIKNGHMVYKNSNDQIIYQVQGIDLQNDDLVLSQEALEESFSTWALTSSSHGRLTVDAWQWGPWKLSDLELFYNISHGKITFSPVLYVFNSVPGKASFILHHEQGQWHAQLKNHIENAVIRAQDLAKSKENSALQFATLPLIFDIEHGKLSVITDIAAKFNDFDDIDSHLNGQISLKLTDGKIKRFNLGYELQRLEDRVNRIEDSDPPKTNGTEFKEFSINMGIKEGSTQPFPVILEAKDFSFRGQAQINMVKDPAWMKMRVYIKPQPGRFPKLESVLNEYLGDSHQGAIPLEFSSPLYKPSQMAITVDTSIVEKVLNDFFASWPEGVKNKLVNKLQGKLKKSLKKMQTRLNEGTPL